MFNLSTLLQLCRALLPSECTGTGAERRGSGGKAELLVSFEMSPAETSHRDNACSHSKDVDRESGHLTAIDYKASSLKLQCQCTFLYSQLHVLSHRQPYYQFLALCKWVTLR